MIDTLPRAIQDNVLRVQIAAEQRAKSLGLPFEMSLDKTAQFMADTCGLDDPAYQLPAGLVGKWWALWDVHTADGSIHARCMPIPCINWRRQLPYGHEGRCSTDRTVIAAVTYRQ